MSALTSARVTDGIMTLSVSPPWLKESFSIYERESYKDIYKIIFEGDAAQNNLDVIILGNPGIGKSYFALYALSNVLRAGKNVIFHCVPHNVVYWFRPRLPVLHANSLPLLNKKSDCMLFVDAEQESRECSHHIFPELLSSRLQPNRTMSVCTS